MALKVRGWHDLLSGILFVMAGAGAIVGVSRLPLGTAAFMGSAAFPTVIGGGLLVTGAVLIVRSLRGARQSLPTLAWRPILMVTGALVVFALSVPRIGFVASAAITLAIAAYASYAPRFTWGRIVVFALSIATLAAVLFKVGLGLPFELWP